MNIRIVTVALASLFVVCSSGTVRAQHVQIESRIGDSVPLSDGQSGIVTSFSSSLVLQAPVAGSHGTVVLSGSVRDANNVVRSTLWIKYADDRQVPFVRVGSPVLPGNPEVITEVRDVQVASDGSVYARALTVSREIHLCRRVNAEPEIIASSGDTIAPGVRLGMVRSQTSRFLGGAPCRVTLVVPLVVDGREIDGAIVRLQSGRHEVIHAGVTSPLPDSNGATPGLLFRVTFNSRGDVLLIASLEGAGVDATNDRALYRATEDGVLRKLIRESEPISDDASAPRVSAFLFTAGVPPFSPPSMNDQGQVVAAVQTTYNGTSRSGLWTNRSGVGELLCEQGTVLPAPAGATMSMPIQYGIRRDGTVFWNGTLVGSGVNSGNDRALVEDRDGGVVLLAREGGIVADPQSGDTVTFGSGAFGYSASPGFPLYLGATVRELPGDEYALITTIAGAGISSNDTDALVRVSRSGSTVIAREAQPLSSLPRYRVASLNLSRTVLYTNERGAIVFFPSLESLDGGGIARSAVALSPAARGELGYQSNSVLRLPDGSLGTVATVAESQLVTERNAFFAALRLQNSSAGNEVLVSLRASDCRPDYDGDGNLGVQDLFLMLGGYFRTRADFNRDYQTSLQDIFDLLAVYLTGC